MHPAGAIANPWRKFQLTNIPVEYFENPQSRHKTHERASLTCPAMHFPPSAHKSSMSLRDDLEICSRASTRETSYGTGRVTIRIIFTDSTATTLGIFCNPTTTSASVVRIGFHFPGRAIRTTTGTAHFSASLGSSCIVFTKSWASSSPMRWDPITVLLWIIGNIPWIIVLTCVARVRTWIIVRTNACTRSRATYECLGAILAFPFTSVLGIRRNPWTSFLRWSFLIPPVTIRASYSWSCCNCWLQRRWYCWCCTRYTCQM